MTDLPEPGPVRELKDLRADVVGRPPEELHRARGLLLADIQAERGAGDSSHPAFLPRRASRPRLAIFGGVAAAVVATAMAMAMVLLPSPPRPLPPTGGSPGPRDCRPRGAAPGPGSRRRPVRPCSPRPTC
jgi:hypothetical protein